MKKTFDVVGDHVPLFQFLALRFLGVPRPLGVPTTGVPDPCLEVLTRLRLNAGLLVPRLREIFDVDLFILLAPALLVLLLVGRGIDDCLLLPTLVMLELLPPLLTATSLSRGGGDEALPSLSIEASVSMELFMVSSVN